MLLLPWFLLAYFPRKDRIESERLERFYGDRYARYCEQVPALLPRIHAWRPAPELEHGVDRKRTWSAHRFDDNNELGTLIALGAGLLCFTARIWFWPGL